MHLSATVQEHRPAPVALEFDTIETVKRAIEVGEGIGLLPAPTFAAEVQAGSLVRVDLTHSDGTPDSFFRPLGVIRLRTEDPAPAAQRFIDLLQRHADDPPDLPARYAAPSERTAPA